MANLLAFHEIGRLEAGCDEAGRGCLSGPVVAAAVILNPEKPILGLNDSKQINERNRLLLREQIMEHALAYAIGVVTHLEIDEINILNASILAMHLSLADLNQAFEHILVDGNRFKAFHQIPHTTVIKGDGIYQSIAAASILAKTHRDDFMAQLDQDFPQYAWGKNKGYPTQAHRQAIAQYGACVHHRKSFTLLPSQLQLF
jgi:ribonuclease HII